MSSTLVANNLLSSVSGADVDLNLLVSGDAAIIANTARIKEVVDPDDPQDAATKNYVDTVVAGGLTYTPISFAGVESVQTVTTDPTGTEYADYLQGNAFDVATVADLLQNSRGYSEADAGIYAPAIVSSFQTAPTQQDWTDRYNKEYSVDGQVIGNYASEAGSSYDDILFFNTETNMVRGWSPVTNLVVDQDGLNYKLFLDGRSYFTDDTQFFRRSVNDAFVRLSPYDFEVPGYVARVDAAIPDLTEKTIIEIPTINNGTQLTDFKVISHYVDATNPGDKWVAEYLIHFVGGDTVLVGQTSFESSGFLSPVPFFITFEAPAAFESNITVKARLNDLTPRPNARIVSKVDVENVINPV